MIQFDIRRDASIEERIRAVQNASAAGSKSITFPHCEDPEQQRTLRAVGKAYEVAVEFTSPFLHSEDIG